MASRFRGVIPYVIPGVLALLGCWEIEVPKDLVGRLIGKQGRFMNSLRQASGAKIYVSTLLIGKKFKELCLTNIYGLPAAPGPDGAWLRAQVISYFEESNEVELRYVDYGGYDQVKIDTLRQIRSDFLSLPFQGAEVLLDNVVPLPDEDHFSSEADAAVSEMTRGAALVAQAECQRRQPGDTGRELASSSGRTGIELLDSPTRRVGRVFLRPVASKATHRLPQELDPRNVSGSSLPRCHWGSVSQTVVLGNAVSKPPPQPHRKSVMAAKVEIK
ncbi:A-kinase anchor protein 1, mitochondrial-like [Morus bassanus]